MKLLPRRLKKELQKFLDQDNRTKRASKRLRRWFRALANELRAKEAVTNELRDDRP